jgi:hypothetical protein
LQQNTVAKKFSWNHASLGKCKEWIFIEYLQFFKKDFTDSYQKVPQFRKLIFSSHNQEVQFHVSQNLFASV